jgi:hypothetical protein
MSEKEGLESTSELPKKPYTAPELRDYGRVSKLTQGGGYIGNDGNTKCDTGQASANPEGCS